MATTLQFIKATELDRDYLHRLPKIAAVIMLLLLTLPMISSAEDTIRPFTTDGCSSWPEGTRAKPQLWHSCCVEHDKVYWQGGTQAQRRDADRALRQCVKSLGKPITGAVMELGVRLGGHPYLPTRFRWGYGWPYPSRYESNTQPDAEPAP